MELSIWERIGSRRLLDFLDTADLFSLAGTVTKKKSTAFTRTGAIDRILQNSKSAFRLLNHRKVLSNAIVQYLKNEGVFVPKQITKTEAILKTTALWKNKGYVGVSSRRLHSPLVSYGRHENVSSPCVPAARTFILPSITQQHKGSASDSCRLFYCDKSTSTSPLYSPLPDTKKNWNLTAQTSVMDDSVGVSSAGLHPPLASSGLQKDVSSPYIPAARSIIPSLITQQHKGSASDSCRLFYCDKSTSTSPIHSPLQDTKKTWNLTAQTSVMDVEQDTAHIWPVDCEMFAHDFCEWFYSLLNSQNPSSGLQKKDWGPQHFLGHAVLHLTYMSDRRKYNGSGNTSLQLLTLVQEDNLSFQPNITSEKVKCERSPKGMVVVSVGGTILKNKTYLGPFHQVFEIVGNSSGDKWKIRSIDLKIMGGS